jgi:hypothetical protein
MRARNALLARAGLARTFGGLASFLAVIFLGGGIYLLRESFTDPLQAQAWDSLPGVDHRPDYQLDLFLRRARDSRARNPAVRCKNR